MKNVCNIYGSKINRNCNDPLDHHEIMTRCLAGSISTPFGLIAIECCINIHVPLRMNYDDFSYHLTIHSAKPVTFPLASDVSADMHNYGERDAQTYKALSA